MFKSKISAPVRRSQTAASRPSQTSDAKSSQKVVTPNLAGQEQLLQTIGELCQHPQKRVLKKQSKRTAKQIAKAAGQPPIAPQTCPPSLPLTVPPVATQAEETFALLQQRFSIAPMNMVDQIQPQPVYPAASLAASEGVASSIQSGQFELALLPLLQRETSPLYSTHVPGQDHLTRSPPRRSQLSLLMRYTSPAACQRDEQAFSSRRCQGLIQSLLPLVTHITVQQVTDSSAVFLIQKINKTDKYGQTSLFKRDFQVTGEIKDVCQAVPGLSSISPATSKAIYQRDLYSVAGSKTGQEALDYAQKQKSWKSITHTLDFNELTELSLDNKLQPWRQQGNRHHVMYTAAGLKQSQKVGKIDEFDCYKKCKQIIMNETTYHDYLAFKKFLPTVLGMPDSGLENIGNRTMKADRFETTQFAIWQQYNDYHLEQFCASKEYTDAYGQVVALSDDLQATLRSIRFENKEAAKAWACSYVTRELCARKIKNNINSTAKVFTDFIMRLPINPQVVGFELYTMTPYALVSMLLALQFYGENFLLLQEKQIKDRAQKCGILWGDSGAGKTQITKMMVDIFNGFVLNTFEGNDRFYPQDIVLKSHIMVSELSNFNALYTPIAKALTDVAAPKNIAIKNRDDVVIGAGVPVVLTTNASAPEQFDQGGSSRAHHPQFRQQTQRHSHDEQSIVAMKDRFSFVPFYCWRDSWGNIVTNSYLSTIGAVNLVDKRSASYGQFMPHQELGYMYSCLALLILFSDNSASFLTEDTAERVAGILAIFEKTHFGRTMKYCQQANDWISKLKPFRKSDFDMKKSTEEFRMPNYDGASEHQPSGCHFSKPIDPVYSVEDVELRHRAQFEAFTRQMCNPLYSGKRHAAMCDTYTHATQERAKCDLALVRKVNANADDNRDLLQSFYMFKYLNETHKKYYISRGVVHNAHWLDIEEQTRKISGVGAVQPVPTQEASDLDYINQEEVFSDVDISVEQDQDQMYHGESVLQTSEQLEQHNSSQELVYPSQTVSERIQNEYLN